MNSDMANEVVSLESNTRDVATATVRMRVGVVFVGSWLHAGKRAGVRIPTNLVTGR